MYYDDESNSNSHTAATGKDTNGDGNGSTTDDWLVTVLDNVKYTNPNFNAFLLTPKEIIRDTVSSWILNFFRHGRRCHRSFLFILPPISSASTLHIYSCVRVCVRLRYPSSCIVTISVCAGIPWIFRSVYH